jgi:hypothetical protein
MRLTATIPQPAPLLLRRRRLQRVPAPAKLRTAQITPGARFDSQYFPSERWHELEQYRPEMLVGSAADLHWLAEKARMAGMQLNSVNHAIFVLTALGDIPAADTLRVVLWQAFGVPVHELFVGADGTVLAGECEAHEGWHVESGCRFYFLMGEELVADSRHIKGIRTGLSGTLETQPCSCGRPSTRITDVKLRPAMRNRLLLAATA